MPGGVVKSGFLKRVAIVIAIDSDWYSISKGNIVEDNKTYPQKMLRSVDRNEIIVR